MKRNNAKVIGHFQGGDFDSMPNGTRVCIVGLYPLHKGTIETRVHGWFYPEELEADADSDFALCIWNEAMVKRQPRKRGKNHRRSKTSD